MSVTCNIHLGGICCTCYVYVPCSVPFLGSNVLLAYHKNKNKKYKSNTLHTIGYASNTSVQYFMLARVSFCVPCIRNVPFLRGYLVLHLL